MTGHSHDNDAKNQNPYAAPAGAVIAHAAVVTLETGLRTTPAVLPWGAGKRWFAGGWHLFKRAPGKLIGIGLLYIAVIVLLSLIPVAGDLFSTLLSGIWVAGWLLIFSKLAADEPLPVVTLFDGFFLPSRLRLLMLGLIYLAGLIGLMVMGVVVLLAVTGFNPMADDAMSKLPGLFQQNILLFMAALFLFFAGILVIYAFIAFAPALIVLHDVPVFQACTLSAQGFLRNWRAMTVFGLLLLLWSLACVLTLFIGFLVLMPVVAGAFFVSYRQIFVEGDAV